MTRSKALSTIQRWLPVILWCLAILALSSIPGRTISQMGLRIPDKLVHTIEYAVLGYLALRQQLLEGSISRRRAVITALVLGIAVGALDESYQRLIPQRTPSWGDFVADSIGVSLGVSFALWRQARRRPGTQVPSARPSSGDPR